MSIDSVIIKVLYQLPNVYVDKDKFDFKYFESLPGFRKSCRDKSPEEKRIHFPTISIMKDNHGQLEIAFEFSCGKFLNGNNIETLTKKDFLLLIDKLYKELRIRGIDVPKEYLIDARPSRFDACMVIDLTNYASCTTVMQVLSKIAFPQNIKVKRKGFPQAEFDGHQFILTNKSQKKEWRLSIYDKISEINSSEANKNETVLIDINGKMIEKTVPEALKLMNVKQLLRIEFQALTPKEIKKQLAKQGVDTNYINFETLFNQDIASKMILNCWNQYIKPHLSSGLLQRMNEHNLKDKAKKQGIPAPEIMQMICYKRACSMYQNGINDIIKEFPDENLRGWISKAEKTFNKIKDADKTSVARTFTYIYKCIKEQVPFKFRV